MNRWMIDRWWRKRYGKKEEVGQKRPDHWNQLCCCIAGSGLCRCGILFPWPFLSGTVINETNFSLGTVEAAEAKLRRKQRLSAGCPRQRRPGLLYQRIRYWLSLWIRWQHPEDDGWSEQYAVAFTYRQGAFSYSRGKNDVWWIKAGDIGWNHGLF